MRVPVSPAVRQSISREPGVSPQLTRLLGNLRTVLLQKVLNVPKKQGQSDAARRWFARHVLTYSFREDSELRNRGREGSLSQGSPHRIGTLQMFRGQLRQCV